jgi:Protein of unknown function (DUF3097)
MSPGILGPGIDDAGSSRSPQWPRIPATPGMRVMHRGSRFIGVVVGYVADGVTLRGASGDERSFRLTPGGFLVEAKVVTLVRPTTAKSDRPSFTASGSIAAPASPGPRRAKVARASRLWVEGLHDAELVEKIWGDDLRDVGIVVERLDGLDDLASAIAAFGPSEDAKLGILVDHLVPRSKESRIADACRSDVVMITGHQYVDVWQAIRPHVLGIAEWPTIPTSEDWKTGICQRVGPAIGASDPPSFWREILRRTTSIADLEPSFVGAVETLLDELLDVS